MHIIYLTVGILKKRKEKTYNDERVVIIMYILH